MVEQKLFLCDKRRGRSDKWSDYKTHIVSLTKNINRPVQYTSFLTIPGCDKNKLQLSSALSLCLDLKHRYLKCVFIEEGHTCAAERPMCCNLTAWDVSMGIWSFESKTSRQTVSQVRRGQKSLYTASCYGMTSLTGQHKLSGHWHHRGETGYYWNMEHLLHENY